jgi:hypothetical protein
MAAYSAPEPTGAAPSEKLVYPVVADYGEGVVLDVAWCRSRVMAEAIALALTEYERSRDADELAQLRDLLGDDASF